MFLLITFIFAAYPSLNGASVVIGNRRGTHEGVQGDIAKIVEHQNADFSHDRTFGGGKNAVSIDIGGPSYVPSAPHIQADWLALPCAPNLLENVLFEWFPTCDPSPGNTLWQPLLLPAIEKAFETLRPGGLAFIDFQPYTCTLPDTCEEAIKLGVLPVDIFKRLHHAGFPLSKNKEERETGVLPHLLQQYDPFTLHFSNSEKIDIADILLAKFNSKPFQQTQLDSATNLTVIDQALFYLKKIFSKQNAEMKDFIGELNNQIRFDEPQKFGTEHLMFEWVYGVLSRGQGMIKALIKMGFTVSDDAIQYHENNPFNKRKHAWIISAKKPVKTAEP